MAKVIDIPGSSGKTPFELCDEQYFLCTNTEISTLGEMSFMQSFDPIEYLRMGYTNLYFLQRLILIDPANDIHRTYPETTETIWSKSEYCVIGSLGIFQRPHDCPFSYPTLPEAENGLEKLKALGQNPVYVIARMLEETYWH